MIDQILQIINRIQEAAQQLRQRDNLMHETLHGIADDLEAAIEPQWVPVAERLPDHCLSVMVLDRDGNMDTAWYGGNSCREYDPDPYAEITHWHEIEYPEPPEATPQ